jgi:hypothetical protein
MIGRVRLALRRRQLRGSLAADSLQPPDWERWLESAASLRALRDDCPEPGWLMHLAFWSTAPTAALFEAGISASEEVIGAGASAGETGARLWPLIARGIYRSERSAVLELLARLSAEAPPVQAAFEGASLWLPDALILNGQRMHAITTPSPSAAPAGEIAKDLCVAIGFLTVAALQIEYGNRAVLAQSLGRALALLARRFSEHRAAMLERLRARLPPVL